MSAIKTKIGFETKPDTIQSIKIYEYFVVSAQKYGTLLLSVSIFLSGIDLIYLQSMKTVKIQELYELQQTEKSIQAKYNQLQVHYKALSSKPRLKQLGHLMGMHKPTPNCTIYTPKNILN